MAIKEVRYSRTFLSKTDQTDTSYHGSPTYVDYQEISEEDKKIRKEAEREFGFEVRHSKFGSSKEMFGFDGTMQYFFSFSGHPPEKEDRSKNILYQTEVYIRKAGSSENVAHNVDSASDLELFLINNKFELQRK